jgi:hypothetical protein
VGAADLPGGGLVALDLGAPSKVFALLLTSAHWSELGEVVDGATDLDAVADRLRGRVETPDLSETWLRLAFVTGLARWYPDPLDEGLVAADLAAAQAAVGLTADAEDSWRRAEPSVAALLAGPLEPSAHEELVRVLAAVGSDVVPVAPRVRSELAKVAGSGGHRRTRSVTTLDTSRNLRPVADPRNFPSRALLPSDAYLEMSGTGVVISCPDASEAAATIDLRAIAYDASQDPPAEVASVALARDADGYRGELDDADLAARIRAHELVVEIRDPGSIHPPLLDPVAADEIVVAQHALGRVRRARSNDVTNDASYVRSTLAELVGP